MLKNIQKQLFTFAFTGLVLFLIGCGGGAKVKTTKNTTIKREGIYHTLEKGQTVYQVARSYNVDTKTLLRENNISDPTNLEIGRKIFVPRVKAKVKVASVPTRPKKDKPKTISKSKPKNNNKPQNAKYRKPVKVKPGYFDWPVKGKLTSRFGSRKGRAHDGLDIANKRGTVIRAAAPGKVVFSDWGPSGYGKMVIIKHDDHLMTIHAHNDRNLVAKNQLVEKGEKIALLGQTGRATGPHLHFEIRNNRKPEDPLKYLP